MDGHVGQHHAGRQEGGVGGVMIGLSECGTSRRGCEPVLEGHGGPIYAVSTTSESWRTMIEDDKRIAAIGGLQTVRHNAPTVFDRLLASRASDAVLLTVGATSGNLVFFYRSVIFLD